MPTNELLEALERLLDDAQVSQETINRLTLALALDNRSRLEEAQERTARELAELRELIRAQSENVSRLARAVEGLEGHLRTHPTLLYLLRFRTRETVAVLVLVFLLLSVWYVSGIRQPILKWLGLPVF